MKEQRIRFTTALTACSCGAVPYDPDVRPKGQVGLTRCGCVGERGRTQIDAADRWDARRLKYGPLKEDKDK